MGIELGDPRLPERFWSKVAPDEKSGCWNWAAARDKRGYGKFGETRRRIVFTHRHAYLTLIGNIAAGLVLDHLCRNTSCCNPAHLEPVTNAENMRRSPLVGRMHQPSLSCPHGHEFTPENTLYKRAFDQSGTPTKWRICKTCNRRQCARYSAHRKAA